MRLLTTAVWPLRRGLLLAGGIATSGAILIINLPSWSIAILAAVLLLSLLVPVWRHPVWVFTAITAAVVMLCGCLYQWQTVYPSKQAIGQSDTITATVQEVPAAGHMVTVKIVAATHLPRGTRVLLYCPEQAMPARYETVCGEVEYRPLYATQKRYRADNIFLLAYPTAFGEAALTITAGSPSFAATMNTLRTRLLDELYTRLPTEDGALLAGLCLGDVSGVSADTKTAFRQAGLPHLLVVSGLHLSAVAAGAYAVLRLLLHRRRAAAIGAIGVVVLFALLVGLSPSVVRAGVASIVMLSGQLFHRRADGLNSMGLALLLLLTTNPYSLFDAGLLLSFGATAGILCLFSPLYHALRSLGRWLAGGLAATLAASLPIAPILAGLFGEISLVSPLANLLTVGPSGLALLCGCVAMPLALIPPLTFAADGLFFLAAWPARWIRLVATLAGELPFASLSISPMWAFAYLTGGCIFGILCIYTRNRRLMRRLAAALFALGILAGGVSAGLTKTATRIQISAHRDGAVLLLEQDGCRGLLVPHADHLYTPTNVQQLDFLIIGDGETPDTARLTELLQQISVKRLLIGGTPTWLTGTGISYTPLPTQGSQPLWNSTVLTIQKDGSWLLRCGDSTVALNPTAACDADAAIFVGELPHNNSTYHIDHAILVTDTPSTNTQTPFPLTVLTNGELYLTARDGGDWSITQWQ